MTRRYLKTGIAGEGKLAAGSIDVSSHAQARIDPDLTGDLLGSHRRVLLRTDNRHVREKPGQRSRHISQLICGALLFVVLWQWGSAGWILVKAQLAQWLIAQAWDASLMQPDQRIKPWPWADTHPIARLRMPREGVDLFVLEGAQGNSLAFGPGHLQGTALPGEGTSVIGGHRDTHFRFLKDVSPGDELLMQTRAGRRLSYRIEQTRVVDTRQTPLHLEDFPGSGLVLVTCYPFDALDPNGPLRLVVWAREVEEYGHSPLHIAGPGDAPIAAPLVFSL